VANNLWPSVRRQDTVITMHRPAAIEGWQTRWMAFTRRRPGFGNRDLLVSQPTKLARLSHEARKAF